MVLVSRAQGLTAEGIIIRLVKGNQAKLGKGLGLNPMVSEESLQDVKQVNPRAEVYVRNLPRTANLKG